jgi:O-acetyl-ADP-ribose deacetylase (regulator of RNase III)
VTETIEIFDDNITQVNLDLIVNVAKGALHSGGGA